MTEPDDVAIDALRRLDQPHDLDTVSSWRIETRMLDRFDDVAAGVRPSGNAGEIVELRTDAGTPSRRRGALWLGLAAAAVVMVVGAFVFLRTGAQDVDVPATQPTESVDEQQQIVEQLRSYCAEFIQPLVTVSALWTPEPWMEPAPNTEERSDVLVATEIAAQGLVDLGAPAALLFGDRDLEILELATDARRAVTLGPGSEEAVVVARDAVLFEIDATPAAAGLTECATS